MIAEAKTIIDIRNIEKIFQVGEVQVRALRGVDLAIKEGSYVAIMGPSGSGKSTMLNILGCLDRPTTGQYFLGGEDVSAMDDDTLSAIRGKRLGFIFQSYNLIAQLTVIENIQVPLIYQGVNLKDYEQKCLDLAKLVGLGQRLDHRPTQLSGGQQQLVGVARAVVGKPKLLLADEPTGNLHSTQGKVIMDTLAELHDEGMTIIQVTHDENNIKYSTRVIELWDGFIKKPE